MGDVTPIKRPVHWDNLRADEAEKVVRERAAKSENVIISNHAFDRITDRSILQQDVYRILKTGMVSERPAKNDKGDWEVIVAKRLEGRREAGVVTIVFGKGDQLFVKTVMWMDIKR